jgi:colicin import membrane protein
MNTTETATTVEQLESQALSWPNRAKALVVKDQDSLDQAGELLGAIKDLRKQVADEIGPVVAKAFEAHKAATALRKKLDEPLEQAERILKGSSAVYMAGQKRIAEAEARRIEEELRKQQEEAQEAAIEQAEASGANEAEVLAMIEQTAYQPPPRVAVAPTFEAPKGVAMRTTLKAEVESLGMLVQYLANHPEFINLVLPNMPAINALLKAQGKALRLPGVRIYEESTLAVGRR